MVTFNKRYRPNTDGKIYCEGECLSTDTKPTTDIMNGSKLLEMDTGKLYAFDEDGEAWLELPGANTSTADTTEAEPNAEETEP